MSLFSPTDFLHLCCVSLEVMTSGEEIIILRWVGLTDFLLAKQNHMVTCFCLRGGTPGSKGNARKWG